MSTLGWVLFGLGFALLIFGGFVGMDGIANIAALQAGGAIMISGSVLTLHATTKESNGEKVKARSRGNPLAQALLGDEEIKMIASAERDLTQKSPPP